MTLKKTKLTGAALFLTVLPSAAFAHPAVFHTSPFLDGIAHPLSGLDHILAMVAVGLWAAQQGGRALWAWPAAFVGIMLLGGALGMAGVALPMVEPAIAASVLVLGLLIATASALPVAGGAALVALFALFHGNAHGLEAATGGVAAYAAGFAIATALLHGAGLGLGVISRAPGRQTVLRACGGVVALVGATLFFV